MPTFRIERALELPQVLDPSTMYIMKGAEAGRVDLYFTGNDGNEVRRVIGTSDVNDIVTTALTSFNTLEIAATIPARDDLVLSRNCLVLVLDATGDVTVPNGAALYAYDKATTLFYKVSQFEPSGETVEWGTIANRPTSAVADIDEAVTMRHRHDNLFILDKFSIDDEFFLLYDNVRVMQPFQMSKAEW